LNGTQTVTRALDILFALAESNGTLSVGEIAEKVSIPESTTYRFIQILEQNGIVVRKGKGQIRLGMRILDLARSLNQQMDKELLSIALSVMEDLTKSTNETSLLFIRSDTKAICLQNIKSKALIQFSVENGRILPLHSGASGKIILAYENDKLKKRILDQLPCQVDKELLIKELEQIRNQGYSITRGEVDSDVFAISAPILNVDGSIVASLSIAGPNYRCREENVLSMIDSVVKAAKRVSEELGN